MILGLLFCKNSRGHTQYHHSSEMCEMAKQGTSLGNVKKIVEVQFTSEMRCTIVSEHPSKRMCSQIYEIACVRLGISQKLSILAPSKEGYMFFSKQSGTRISKLCRHEWNRSSQQKQQRKVSKLIVGSASSGGFGSRKRAIKVEVAL